MKNGIYTCVILMAFLALSESVYAAIPVLTVASDTIRRVVIYFDKEETDIDFSYKTNNHEINVLDSLLEEKINSRYITALNVVTFVSPDGDSVYNAALSVRRNNSMREFLRQRYPYVDVEKIKLTSEGEDWSELRKLVASDSDLPDREEVLMLIDYHRDNTVKRKELLQKLNQGMAYRDALRLRLSAKFRKWKRIFLNRYLLSPDCLFQSRKRRFRAINLISRREKVKRVWLMRW